MAGDELRRDDLETLIGALGAVDHRGVDWDNVRWSAFLIRQHLRYEYPGEVHDLRQRLMVMPPEWYGRQRLVLNKLEVSVPDHTIDRTHDGFGNLILTVTVPHIARTIDFTAWIVVEREAGEPGVAIEPRDYANPAYHQPTVLTAPDDALLAAAAALRAAGGSRLDLAARINKWVFGELRYAHGVTGVKTTAAEAFAGRQGVCQDAAHIMLALCRACDLPARYVSGHLLGEGGTHAWVEVLLEEPGGRGLVARPFDPTHGTEPTLNYITVAIGRDYADVAPTSGTFRAPYGGRLSARKQAGVTALEYFGAAPDPAAAPVEG